MRLLNNLFFIAADNFNFTVAIELKLRTETQMLRQGRKP
jgi:hypothetical protein